MAIDSLVRRPLKSRSSRWASAIAGVLIRAAVPPNLISLLSVLFAACAGASFLLVSRSDNFGAQALLYLAAAVCIQLRLLCNLMDGMVAVEGGFRSRSGEVYNEVPDRISDVVVLVSIGYALPQFRYARELAWSAALLAVLTAYIRLLGGSLHMPQDFSGPMAKPHRMAVVTIAALGSVAEAALHYRGNVLMAALVIVTVGSLVTFVRRTSHLIRWLEGR